MSCSFSVQHDRVSTSVSWFYISVYFMIAVETYLSPVETHCMNIDYFIPDEENQTRGFSDDAMARLRKYQA